MKKVYVISKTHLDLGFTDYAENVRQQYINSYIPNAVQLAKKVNTVDKKKFVWTTGSWIIKEALKYGSEDNKQELQEAIKRGDVVPHALPFTMHTELLDSDTLEYGLSIVDELDNLCGRKTTAAKMTDVPGHTIGLVKHLAKRGIKLLHIGVNGASALVDVPPCFLWKSGKYEVVVIYSGDYGGEFKCDLIDEILYFNHSLDNHGAPDEQAMLDKFSKIQNEYPDYDVEAGCMDDFSDIIWEKRSQLPVLTDEMGDTWIHGSAADPFKSASLRELMALKRKWLENGEMDRESEEYIDFSDALLCIAEHTCGMDTKKYFADYENYLKSDFQKARKADAVKIKHPFRDFPINFLTLWNCRFGDYSKGSYKVVEKSWLEQREYINLALRALSLKHRDEAELALNELRPKISKSTENKFAFPLEIKFKNYSLMINEFGGIGKLVHNDNVVIKENKYPLIEYRSYSKEHYDFWLKNYIRNVKSTYGWAAGDFLRPLLKYVSSKYPVGRFFYIAENISAVNETDNEVSVVVSLKCDCELCKRLGAPRLIQVEYKLSEFGLEMNVSWFGKDANRLTEAIFLHMYPKCDNLIMHKIDTDVDPYSVVSNGGRNIHAVQSSKINSNNKSYVIENCHSPLMSLGNGKILEFNNEFESINRHGISYILYDNVWGTNFPLWYEDNACFKFRITKA